MVSRTIMKQQIGRQLVMNEEKSQKGFFINNIDSYNENWQNISQNNDILPSLSSTIIGSGKNLGFLIPFTDSPNQINFDKDMTNINSEEYSFTSSDYKEEIDKEDSPYLLHNMCAQESKYQTQSFNTECNVDPDMYSIQYRNLLNKAGSIRPIQDFFLNKISFSCPATCDNSNGITRTRRLGNCIPAMNGLETDTKLSKLKDRSKKESHNRIERKRRDFINHQIIELSHLLPAALMTDGESKKNKGTILKNSVVYIQHLHNETMNASNYVKETDLAFILIDSYRRQIQELQQQYKSVASVEATFSPSSPQFDTYNNYIMLRNRNRSILQSRVLSLDQSNDNASSRDMVDEPTATVCLKSSLSASDDGFAFKIEPCSVQSSLENNSTYRIDEETCMTSFNSLNDLLTSTIPQQPSQTLETT